MALFLQCCVSETSNLVLVSQISLVSHASQVLSRNQLLRCSIIFFLCLFNVNLPGTLVRCPPHAGVCAPLHVMNLFKVCGGQSCIFKQTIAQVQYLFMLLSVHSSVILGDSQLPPSPSSGHQWPATSLS